MKFKADGTPDLSERYAKMKAESVVPEDTDPFASLIASVGLRERLSGAPAMTPADRSWEALSVEPVRSGGVAVGQPLPPAPAAAPQGASGDTLERLMRAIRTKESSGRYDAIGIPTKYGRARGAYQFLPSTYSGFAKQIGVDPSDWSPAAQDKVARHAMGVYLRQFGGDPAKVAQAWYAGPASVGKANTSRRQNGGQMPSISDYAQAILRLMQQ